MILRAERESIEYAIASSGTEVRWFLGRVSPIRRSDGAAKTVCMTARDITARKESEDELRRAKEAAEASQSARRANFWPISATNFALR